MAGKDGPEEKLWLKPCAGGNKSAPEEPGKEGLDEKLLMSGCLRPCTGRKKPVKVESGKEGPQERLWISGGPMRSVGRHAPAVADMEEIPVAAVTGAKRKVEAAGGSSDGGIDAAAANAMEEAAPDDDGKDAASEVKFVEMPKELLSWILSQERETAPLKFECLSPEENGENRQLIAELNASMQETQPLMDNFFEFQAWVRDKFRKNGRVMVPEDFLRGPVPGFQ